jgi:hypothetical protein
MKRPVFIATIVLFASLVAFFMFRNSENDNHRRGGTSSHPVRRTSTEQQMPSARIPTSSNPREPNLDSDSGVASTPVLSFTRDNVQQHRAAKADPELLQVKQTLRDYRAAFGENPVGTNSEITKALLGANARRARFITSEARLNSSRQLVDRWNHPYFFHQLSRVRMEIRSAGPDGILWTTDDEVSR